MVKKSKKDWIKILTFIMVFITLIFTILSYYSDKQGLDKQIDYANKTLEYMTTHKSNMSVWPIIILLIIILAFLIIDMNQKKFK
ncbi:MAG: hypothetical protein ABIC91_01280 [Nanoarchaeota archaeon]|nr:hypothetical protein [Nanoarchaeota archaeon]MBU1029836.1 hypothetical protein [Nanoarchaeota archaeon]MBU1849527.1 hypothetical protein [Nanoarchaeota archaeon]